MRKKSDSLWFQALLLLGMIISVVLIFEFFYSKQHDCELNGGVYVAQLIGYGCLRR